MAIFIEKSATFNDVSGILNSLGLKSRTDQEPRVQDSILILRLHGHPSTSRPRVIFHYCHLCHYFSTSVKHYLTTSTVPSDLKKLLNCASDARVKRGNQSPPRSSPFARATDSSVSVGSNSNCSSDFCPSFHLMQKLIMLYFHFVAFFNSSICYHFKIFFKFFQTRSSLADFP